MAKTTPEELAKALSDFVNVLGGNKDREEEFIALVLNDHRTLQQSTFRLMIRLMDAWAAEGKRGNFDPRNEDTCKACQKVVAFMDEQNIKYLQRI
jgi:hypothetical protein